MPGRDRARHEDPEDDREEADGDDGDERGGEARDERAHPEEREDVGEPRREGRGGQRGEREGGEEVGDDDRRKGAVGRIAEVGRALRERSDELDAGAPRRAERRLRRREDGEDADEQELDDERDRAVHRPSPAATRLIARAGTPTASMPAGTSFVTTAPAPVLASRP